MVDLDYIEARWERQMKGAVPMANEPMVSTPESIARQMVDELRKLRRVVEAARKAFVKMPYHDCRGPSCILCIGLGDALDALNEPVLNGGTES